MAVFFHYLWIGLIGKILFRFPLAQDNFYWSSYRTNIKQVYILLQLLAKNAQFGATKAKTKSEQ